MIIDNCRLYQECGSAKYIKSLLNEKVFFKKEDCLAFVQKIAQLLDVGKFPDCHLKSYKPFLI